MVAMVVHLIGEAVMFDSPKQRKSIDVVLESPRKFIPFESVKRIGVRTSAKVPHKEPNRINAHTTSSSQEIEPPMEERSPSDAASMLHQCTPLC